MDSQQIAQFRSTVWEYYHAHGRTMPWRQQLDPYFIVVSEMMLQQTQVDRAVPKFLVFVARFPAIDVLATASLGDVLAVWVGLGYNRRAKFLHQLAQRVVREHQGQIPQSLSDLVALLGIGPNTAGAILAYAYNQPQVFIETNIRTVFIHHFFADQDSVDDKDIRQLVQATLDPEHPRQWYWALMDYGTYLKKQGAGRVTRSRHYRKQSPFQGSLRQVRGQVIRALTASAIPTVQLAAAITDPRLSSVLAQLIDEQLIQIDNDLVQLT